MKFDFSADSQQLASLSKLLMASGLLVLLVTLIFQPCQKSKVTPENIEPAVVR